MIPRSIVPVGAQLSSAPSSKQKAHTERSLVPKRLIPAGARPPIEAVHPAGSGEVSPRDLMVPKSLVPANARIGEAAVHVPSAPQPVFAEALLERTSLIHQNKPAEWGLSLAVHLIVAAVLVVAPLLYTQRIDFTRFQTTYLAAPPAPAPPPPPAPAMHAARATAPKPGSQRVAKLVMPTAIPKAVAKTVPGPSNASEAPPEIGVGVPGGVEGGVPGGVLGGILGATGPAAPPSEAAPAAPAVVASNTPLRVGGNVKPPRLIYKAAPEYPVLARQTRVQGDVEIDAVIDRNGNVVSARAMSGPTLLIAAALKAVQSWKYEPTYLNGQAYPIELTVHVTFSLS